MVTITDDYVKILADTLKAAGVINTLIFRITEDGEKSYVSPDGYAIKWSIEPIQFSFPETVALGTVTLPSLKITIDSEEGSISFRLPYEYAMNFITDINTNLGEAYFRGIESLKDDFKNAVQIEKSKSRIKKKTKKVVKEKDVELDRGYV